jgi:formylglycine-generating enzyme required for sulfatase activity
MQNIKKYQIIADFLDTLESNQYRLGVAQHLSVQQLLQQLPDDADVETLRLAIVPMLANNLAEQSQFYQWLDEAAKRAAEKTAFAEATNADAAAATTLTKAQRFSKHKIVLSAIAIVLLSFAAWKYYYPTTTPPAVITEKFEGNTTKDSTKTTTKPIEEAPIFQDLDYPFPNHIKDNQYKPPSGANYWLSTNWKWFRWLLALGATLGLLALWRYLVAKRRKLVAQQGQNDKPPYVWNINIEGADDLLLEESLDKVSQLLRSRSDSNTARLDMPRTVAATIAQGGMPDFKYKIQSQPTDYLLLIDRQSVRNHRAKLFDKLYEVFKAQEVEIARYFYDADLRVCYDEAHPFGIALSEVQQKHYQSRLLLVGTGAQLLSPASGKIAQWTDGLFQQWKNRVLLTPKPLQSWSYDERQLANLFQLLPATLQGLGFWIEELNAGTDARMDTWREKISDAPNVPIAPDDADPLPMLQLYFEKPLLRWLAACAIYPSLHWDLTLWLGKQLGEKTKDENLTSYDNLMQLCRLAWFVKGEMPDTTRAALLDWLEKDDAALLLHLRLTLATELERNPPPSDSAAYEQFRMNVALNRWLSSEDAKEKAELESEIAQLLARGAEPDFTVIKYLEAPRTALDFVIPDAWKKYVYPSGFAALGWLKQWKDLRWLLPIWALAMFALFWNYNWNQDTNCEPSKLVTLSQKGQNYQFCLSKPKQAITYQEQLIINALDSSNTSLALEMLSPDARLNQTDKNHALSLTRLLSESQRKDTSVQRLLQERDANIAVAYYKVAKGYFEKGNKDSTCYYLSMAKNMAKNIADTSVLQTIAYTQVEVCNAQSIDNKGDTKKKEGKKTSNPPPLAGGGERPNPSSTSDNTVATNTAATTQQTEKSDFDMVFVKGGDFMMGSDEKVENTEADEKPQHKVTLADFYIGKTEVTQKQWRTVMGKDPEKLNFKGCDDCPVERVSWDDIQAFLEVLNKKFPPSGGKGAYRLPTEAEWEYAARGGNKSKYFTYSGSNNLGEVAWFDDNSDAKTHSVATKKANELGIYDMSGNVWEWCSDWYDEKYYSSSYSSNPTGASKGSYRVYRGGSWFIYPRFCRASSRSGNTPTFRSNNLGFRVVLSQ